ncbi:MAG: cell division protein ZipA C-terminal FtsZ-binding domain-containing protein, partial [Propionivibrio sp.]
SAAAETAAGKPTPPAPPPVGEPLHLLSPMIDYVVSFEAVEPAPTHQLVDARRKLEARIRKPQIWVGYNEYTRDWEQVTAPVQGGQDVEYRRLRVGLQLVDRQGPVSDSELSIFYIAMRDLADRLMAIVDLPARQPMLDAAGRLDEFCASVDIQIGINVIAQGQVFPGTKLRALAEAAGMAIDAQGRFVRRDEDGNILFVVLNQEASGFAADTMRNMTTHGLTFLLDVPRVAHGERMFNQMVDLARRFADVLHGVLVDDNRRPLSENALAPIRQQIGHFQSAMAAQHLPAGGALTQRLFS